MKKITIATLILFAVASLSFGQTATGTTLAAPMTRGDQTVNLTSSTGVLQAVTNPNTGLYIDREYMTVTTAVVAGGNVWNVKRSAGGIQSAHALGTPVWVGPPGAFDLGPNDRVGACTGTFFVIEVRTGNTVTCGNGAYQNINAPSVGAVVASAATIVITSDTTHISGVAAIVNITALGLKPGGTITLIPDAVWSTTAAGNISLATAAAVVGKALIMTWDGVKFNPSY